MQRETVAKVLIINDKNQALILQTGEYKDHPEKEHKPDLPGGLVDPNESEHHAVVREVYEEAGIALDPNTVTLGYAETKSYADEDKSVTKLLYLARIEMAPEVTISWEHESYEWAAVPVLLETHEFRPFYQQAITYLRDNQLI
ncbi:MAG: NUDIX domain-containing protein [Candidatus Saccharimonadales bacterium]